MHTNLLQDYVLHDFYELWPQKFSNKTNGVTQRRWMVNSNPKLANLITRRIGGNWIKYLDDLRKLEPLALDTNFQNEWQQVKYENKRHLADYQSYVDCQEQVSQAFQDQAHWTRKSILNSARVGKFSSDRAIREYCEELWKVEPVSVEFDDELSADKVCRAF